MLLILKLVSILNLLDAGDVRNKSPLRIVNKAVVARLVLADFAFVEGTESHDSALVALFLRIAVGLLEHELILGEIVDCLAVELLGTVLVKALLLVNE